MRLPKTFLTALLLAALHMAPYGEAQPSPARSRGAGLQANVDEQQRLVNELNNEVLRLYSESAAEPGKALSAGPAADTFERRAAALRELIGQDPQAALAAALPADVAARLAKAFPGSADRIERYGSFAGVYEVEIEDGETSATTYRSLSAAGGRLALHLDADELEAAADVRSGDWLEVGGLRLGEEIAVESFSTGSEKLELATAQQVSCSTTGAQRVAVIKVKFPGTSPSLPNAELRDWMFGSTGQTLNRFWQENSSGAAWATGDVFPAGTNSWYTLNREYSCDESAALRDAALKAANAATDFRNYSRVIVVFPRPSSGCSFAGRSSVGCWLSNPDGGSTLSYSLQVLESMSSQSRSLELTAHESGHQLGLYHASAVEYGADALGAPSASGKRLEYGDRYSTMGFWDSGHYAAPHKQRLGWLQNVRQVSATGSYRVQESSQAPNSSGGAVQALEIARGGQKLWVEFRRRLGEFWSSSVSNPSAGALLHLDNGSGQSLLLDFTPQSGSSSGSYYSADFDDATLNAGRTWRDPYSDLSLTVTGASNSGLDLQVSYGAPPPCVSAVPQVTLSPASQTVTYPQAASYQVKLKNNDGAGCSAATFSLNAQALLNGQATGEVSAQLATSVLTVSPGATLSTTLQAKPQTAPTQAKSYMLQVRGARGNQQAVANVGLAVLPAANAAPQITIQAPANGTSVAPGTTLTFRGTAKDAEDGDIAAKLVWRSSRDGQIGTGASFTKQLTSGTHTVTATAKDKSGLSGSAAITVTVTTTQNAPPAVTIQTPTQGTSVAQGTALTFRGTAKDAEDGDIAAKLVWRSSLDGQIGIGASFTKQLTAGTHTITAVATDKSGLIGVDAATVFVTATQNTRPAVTIQAPANGTSVAQGTTLTFRGTAKDAEDGDISAKLVWRSSRDGQIGIGASFTKQLTAGTHTITATAADKNGLSGVAAATVTVTAPNARPVVTIQAPANGTSVAQGTTLTFRGTANDAEDGNIAAKLVWRSSRDGQIGIGASFTKQLTAGTHTITATAADKNGLSGVAAITVTVTSPPPPSTTTTALKVYPIELLLFPRGDETVSRASLLVLKPDGQPLAGAVLSGYWTLNGQPYHDLVLTSNADGLAQAGWTFTARSGDVIGYIVTAVQSSVYSGTFSASQTGVAP